MKSHLFGISTLILALATFAPAQSVPPLINYQGRLANPDGTPLPTGDYELRFRVYDSATNSAATNLIWGPQVFDGAVGPGHAARIPVMQGYFNVMLGPVDTNGVSLADAFTASNRYVEVTVGNRSPILPRQQILTTPFAFQAANSAKLAGYDWSSLLGTNNPVARQVAGSNFLAGESVSFSKLTQRERGTNVGIGGVAVSGSVNSFVSNANSYVPVPGLSVSLQTTGRPVLVMLVPGLGQVDTDNDVGTMRAFGNTGYNAGLALYRDDVFIQTGTATVYHPGPESPQIPISSFRFLDLDASSGVSHVYSIRLRSFNGANVEIEHARLVAFEF